MSKQASKSVQDLATAAKELDSEVDRLANHELKEILKDVGGKRVRTNK
jgi:hypothetical protein